MKRILYISIIILFVLTSCRKVHHPVADFTIDSSNLVVGQELFFINNSAYGVNYDWDFGDGFGSDEFEPYHTYDSNGNYTITLTVTGEDGDKSVAELDIEIKIPTMLVIEVVEYFQEDLIEGAEVRLYESLVDWDLANDEWVIMGVTDVNGVTVFSNLGPYVYFVDAYKGYNTVNGYDNYALRNEDVDFIMTPTIMPNQINWFTAWVDIADHTATKGNKRSLVIKKFERKPADKLRTQSGKELDWRELYKMSVKK